MPISVPAPAGDAPGCPWLPSIWRRRGTCHPGEVHRAVGRGPEHTAPEGAPDGRRCVENDGGQLRMFSVLQRCCDGGGHHCVSSALVRLDGQPPLNTHFRARVGSGQTETSQPAGFSGQGMMGL